MPAIEGLGRTGMPSGLWALGTEKLLMRLSANEVHFLKLHPDHRIRMTQRRILKEIKP